MIEEDSNDFPRRFCCNLHTVTYYFIRDIVRDKTGNHFIGLLNFDNFISDILFYKICG